MKIAVVHNLGPGGAHRRLSAQVAAFTGHEVLEVTLSTGLPITASAVVMPARLTAARSARLLRPPLRYLDFLTLLRAWNQAANVVNCWGPDICFLNPCQYLKTPPVVAEVDCPVVYYCDEPRRAFHDPGLGDTLNPTTRRLYHLLRLAEAKSERRNTAAADCVATNSSYTARLIQEAFGISSTLVPCGVAKSFSVHETFAPSHLLSVGTLIPTKGHDLVIEAAARSNVDLPVVVVSPRDGTAEERARLEQLAAGHHVELEIRIAIPEAELRELYRSAFATLYLAQGEPFGLASLEAQACGSPVIVADEGGLPETVDEGRSGWCVARNAQAAAMALDRLLDPQTRQQAVACASVHAARFTWEESVQSLEAVFAAVA
jgi:glycosyltransferase involved in cell wall biosynthesis